MYPSEAKVFSTGLSTTTQNNAAAGWFPVLEIRFVDESECLVMHRKLLALDRGREGKNRFLCDRSPCKIQRALIS
jgi:hypothetical protein